MNYDYQYIEKLLLRLLSMLLTAFTDSERKEVHEFIDVGEYGLALETLVDIIREEGKTIPFKALPLVYELVELMGLDKDMIEEKLRGHIVDS